MNKAILILCLLGTTSRCFAQAPDKPVRHFNERAFAGAGFDITHYDWRNQNADVHIVKSEKGFRTADALLGTGLTCAFLGSGALVTGALESRLSPAIRPYHATLIISGIALNLVVMPVCLVVRDVVRKKALKHVQAAKARMTDL